MVEITKTEAEELADFVVSRIYQDYMFNVTEQTVVDAIKDFLQTQHNNKYWYNNND